MVLWIPGMLFDDLIADGCFLETDLPLYLELAEYFVDVGDLVLPWQHSIVTVKVANHHVFLVPALLLQKLLIAILEQLLIILPTADQQHQLQDHDGFIAQILEMLLVLLIIRDVEDHKGEMVE